MSQTLPGFPPSLNSIDGRVVTESALVRGRLFELHPSLTEAVLREANEHGYRDRLEATPLHAPTAAGTYHWNGTVFALRSNMSEKGWVAENLRNCPFVVSPDRSVAIAVMTGDSDTGLEKGNPSNQAQKGAVLKQAIESNLQLELFNAGRVANELARSDRATQLWILLYHVALTADNKTELRAELSLPARFERKRIVGWTERVILARILPDETPVFGHDRPNGPFDVTVERRMGT